MNPGHLPPPPKKKKNPKHNKTKPLTKKHNKNWEQRVLLRLNYSSDCLMSLC